MQTASTQALQITLTDAAQERILDLRDSPHQPAMIRLFIQGGGCSGFEYRIEKLLAPQEDDFILDINPYLKLYVDPFSAPYLTGTTVDFQQEMLSSRFVFNNPQAASTCGCGSSFSLG